MIADVDLTLRRMLAGELVRLPGCLIRAEGQVTFDAPAVAEANQDGEARLNLHLHDIRENTERRGEGFQRLREGAESRVGTRRPPVHLDLTYLATAHAGGEPRLEHRLLSDLLHVLMRYLAVPETYLSGTLSEKGPNALSLAVGQPEHLAGVDLPALWQAMASKMRPALLLRVTAPFNPFETRWTIAVREAVLGTAPRQPGAAGDREPERQEVRASAAGVALRQDTEEPIPGVAVTVEGWPDAGTETDGRGFFRVLNLTAGSHRLRFECPGYVPQEQEAVAPPSGRPDLLEPVVVALRPLGGPELSA